MDSFEKHLYNFFKWLYYFWIKNLISRNLSLWTLVQRYMYEGTYHNTIYNRELGYGTFIQWNIM